MHRIFKFEFFIMGERICIIEFVLIRVDVVQS